MPKKYLILTYDHTAETGLVDQDILSRARSEHQRLRAAGDCTAYVERLGALITAMEADVRLRIAVALFAAESHLVMFWSDLRDTPESWDAATRTKQHYLERADIVLREQIADNVARRAPLVPMSVLDMLEDEAERRDTFADGVTPSVEEIRQFAETLGDDLRTRLALRLFMELDRFTLLNTWPRVPATEAERKAAPADTLAFKHSKEFYYRLADEILEEFGVAQRTPAALAAAHARDAAAGRRMWAAGYTRANAEDKALAAENWRDSSGSP